jgi:hypothetical protein
MVINADESTSLLALQMSQYKGPEVKFFDHLNVYHILMLQMPVTVAEQSKVCTVLLARKPGSWVRISYKVWMFGVRML